MRGIDEGMLMCDDEKRFGVEKGEKGGAVLERMKQRPMPIRRTFLSITPHYIIDTNSNAESESCVGSFMLFAQIGPERISNLDKAVHQQSIIGRG